MNAASRDLGTKWPGDPTDHDRGGTRKLAVSLAAEIESEIIRQGWPIGKILGSEADLTERYGVSRSVFREAVRLLEHHNVAVVRRGRSGGLQVTKPDPSAVVHAVALFLRHSNVGPRDLFDVRTALEMVSVRLAAERATEDDIVRLREVVESATGSNADELATEGADFHHIVAEISGNQAIYLFVQVVNVLTKELVDHSPIVEVANGAHDAHRAIAEAIAAGDAPLAQRRLLRHFEAAAEAGFPVILGQTSNGRNPKASKGKPRG
jgi:DNA-binding FadR family transcriptional regulator